MHHLKPSFFRLSITLVLLLLTTVAGAADWLFRGGKSDYKIVISAEASTSEQTAARELQQYIEKISGARLPKLTESASSWATTPAWPT